MSDRAYIATRKGLFEVYRTHEAWLLDQQHFLGDPVSMVLPDRRDGTLYAALNLGHFGSKLHRRDPGSSEWTEVAAPAFPAKPADSADPDNHAKNRRVEIKVYPAESPAPAK